MKTTTDCSVYWQHADRLPLKMVIEYWCQQSGHPEEHCRQAKSAAILAAVRAGKINWSRNDGKTFDDDPDQLAALGVLVIERESFDRWAEQFSDLSPLPAPDLGPRAETTYLNIIGALLELVRTPRSGRDSEAAVIRELIENYGDKPGISKTTLEAKFAQARRVLNSN